jgi:hypothetical protein
LANNVFQVKRTSTSGRTPNTTGSYVTNSQYIAAGEFALNMADGILYTSNGSAVITVGSNLVNQRISNSVNVDNDKNIRFQTVNTAAYVGMRQQTDDNFVFYSTNTTYGQRPVWSIFANSDTSAFSLSSPTVFNAGVNLGQVSLTANGSTGSAGQVLTTNGSSTYWSTVSGGGSVNTAAQFAWTNIHTFSANVSFNGNGIGIASNTGAVYLGGISDANWRIGRNTGATTKWRYTNNSIDIITANSNLEGMTIGLINGNSYFETGYLGTFIASNVTIGNTSSNATINSTSFTGTASNASLLNNKTEGNLNVNNATTAYSKAESALNVNSALTANNSTNLGGASAASYQTTAGLSANVATLTANNANFVKANNGITSNSLGVFVTQGTGTVVNATGVHVNATYIGTLTANNATNLNGQAASFYTNATNITTGTLPYAQIPANIVNTTGSFTRSGITTFGANVVLGSSGLSANGGFGTAGQTLHSNGTAAYWAADDNAGGTVTSVATGNGMTGGTITTTGTVSILANTGVVANATGVFVNSAYIATIAANNASFLGTVAAASYVQNTDSRTLSGNINFTGVNNFFTGATLGGTAGNIGNNITLFNSVGNAGYFRFYTERNATGADWTTASARLQYRIDVTDMGYMEFNPPNASGVTSGQGLAFGGTDGTEAIRITAAGNVGIGNTAPNAKLQVTGTANVSGAVAIAGITTLSANVVLGTTTITANGGVGSAGQVLTSGATGNVYWASATGGGYYKGGSAAVGTLAVGGQNLFRVNANTLNYNTTIAAGENAQATGPLSVAGGITLTVASGARVSIV